MDVKFDVTKEEYKLIGKISERAIVMAKKFGSRIDQVSIEMDLCACHANGCPLDFKKLAAADDFNLSHDVFGIAQHLNRNTGELSKRFLPRCAK